MLFLTENSKYSIWGTAEDRNGVLINVPWNIAQLYTYKYENFTHFDFIIYWNSSNFYVHQLSSPVKTWIKSIRSQNIWFSDALFLSGPISIRIHCISDTIGLWRVKNSTSFSWPFIKSQSHFDNFCFHLATPREEVEVHWVCLKEQPISIICQSFTFFIAFSFTLIKRFCHSFSSYFYFILLFLQKRGKVTLIKIFW